MSDRPPMIFQDSFVERHNIAWRIEPAEKHPDNPLLEPKFPWDDGVVGCGHGTALKDPIDGKFKAWVTSVSEDTNYVRGQTQFRLTYFESDDGVEWRRPELDICPFPGYPKTNILMDFDSGGRTTYASVFIDPDENPDEPYEMFCFRDPGFRCPSMTVAGLNQTTPPSFADVYSGPHRTYGLYRYRSADGLRWRPVEGPVPLNSGDTCYIHRDKEIGYVAHHKDSLPAPAGGFVPYDVASGQVRVNFRRTSPDGTTWSDRAIMLAADWLDHQADQIMEVGRYPYRDGFIGLTAIYHAYDQTLDLQFAASTDSIRWWRPFPRKPCLPNAPLGDYGGCMIWPTRTLIEHDGRLILYYGGLDALHGDIYAKDQSCTHFHGAWCSASWEIGRLWAAVSSEGGLCTSHLTTPPLDAAGKTLHLNAVTTRSDGRVEAELLDDSMSPIPGFARADCIPFQGDAKSAPLTWEDKSACPRNGVHLRIFLTKALLYGFEWK